MAQRDPFIVPASAKHPPAQPGEGFPQLLRDWRLRRRLSQLEVALSAGVSQRHISFLESGKARPSRTMILQLSETLEVPLRHRNQWLMAAGFAPLFQARPLDNPQMGQVTHAIQRMLQNAAPYPAVAIDRAWNIRMANRSFEMLASALGDDLWQRVGGETRNLMRLFFHPEGIRPYVPNWDAIAPLLWCRAQREAEAAAGEDMRRVLAELAPYHEAARFWSSAESALLPVLPLQIERGALRISLFTVIATFGTAQDITAEELRIEFLFPADEATEIFFVSSARPAQ